MFGQGIGHAFGDSDSFRPRLVSDNGDLLPLTPGMRRQLEDWISEVTEYFMLTCPPEGVVIPEYDPRAHNVYDHWFVAQERELARQLATMPQSKLRDILYARALVLDVLPSLRPTLQHAGLPLSILRLESKAAGTAMLQKLPTLWATTELRRLQHENPGRPWVPQDHGDLITLTMAIVHCDIVVFDRHWGALARRAGLDTANRTILCRFHDLPNHLIAAAA